jgi:hypothetical protein
VFVESKLINEILVFAGPIFVLIGIALIIWRKPIMKASVEGQRTMLGGFGAWAANRNKSGGNVLIVAGVIWALVGLGMTISAWLQLSG